MNQQPMMVQVPVFPQGPDVQTVILAQVPPRVKVAYSLLEHFTAKTATKMMANDVGFDEATKVELSVEEEQAKAAACALMVQYLLGSLKPSLWDSHTGRKKGRTDVADDAVLIIRCPHCGGASPMVKSCLICGGSGEMEARRKKA